MASLGHEGLNNLLAAYPDKGAKAICTFGYSAGPGHEPILFQGITQGKIVPPRGPAFFGMLPFVVSLSFFCLSEANMEILSFTVGWDAIFEYEGET